MKFTIEKTNISKAIGSASRIIEKRNTIPILSNVVLDATESGGLTLRSTDLDLEFQITVGADIQTPGAVTVQGGLLNDIIRKLSGTEVSFSLSSDFVTVSSGRSKFKLQWLSDSDFPDLNAGEFSHQFRIAAADLAKALKNVSFAMSSEEVRYYLCGVFMHTMEVNGELELRFVATDGHRLAMRKLPAPAGAQGMPPIIIPRKTVAELEKMLATGGEVDVQVSNSKMRVRIGESILTSKLIDGSFPDYQRVIPQPSNNVAIFDVKPFVAAVDRVSTISSERGRAIKMTFGEGKAAMEVNNPDSGSATEDVEVSFEASPITIGFNSRYINDLLAQISTDKARVYLIDPGSPTRIEQEGDDEITLVLMPMRV